MRKKTVDEVNLLLEKCFDCFCKNGIERTSTHMLSAACGMSSGNIFHYFNSKDEIIIKSTAYCMAKVEKEFMAKAPQNISDIKRFLNDIPYWTAKKHGKKYRFMYQVYTSPKYRKYGKEFFKGVQERYAEYAQDLEPNLGISRDIILPMIYIFVRASVHYALFEDEAYLKPQLMLIENMLDMVINNKDLSAPKASLISN